MGISVLVSAIVRVRRSGLLVLPWTPPPPGIEVERHLTRLVVGAMLMAAAGIGLAISLALDHSIVFVIAAGLLALAATSISLGTELKTVTTE